MDHLNLAVRTARKAGNILIEKFKEDESLLLKRGTAKQIVTSYDKIIDELIFTVLKEKHPTYGFLTEERRVKGSEEFTWVVDALDGTRNYASGNPFFSICIALLKKKEPIIGVVHAPFLKETYTCKKGEGSYLNGKKIRVSKIRKLRESYVLGCEGGGSNKRFAKINNQLISRVKDFRKLGSAGIECGWVASGRAEAYISPSIYPWDVAAGVLLVKEAGGTVTNFKGGDWRLKKDDLVFSNNKVHNKLLKLLQPLS